MKIKKTWVFIFILIGISLLACSNKKMEDSNANKNHLKVYISIYPLYDFTNKLIEDADNIDVKLLVPNGIEPHGWEPGTEEMNKLEEADVFIYNGAGLESWVEKMMDSLDNQDLKKVEASKGIQLLEGKKISCPIHGYHKGTDPHVWLSPKNAKIEVENIKNALCELDPNQTKVYEKNYEHLAKELDSLDQEFESSLKNRKHNTIIVSHEAFGYLCHDYGLKQIGIEGIHSEHEPDPKSMKKIVDYVKDNNITTIFSETLIDPKVSETIAKETGAKTDVLNPIEGLLKDGEGDYFSIMRENLEALKRALL
ncbi:MAG: metal ABC transporter substrate-binding protein [Tissierellia bacterium]|nr:metal ABC transporter substrate-binding protein [Tissierellia bacterium]